MKKAVSVTLGEDNLLWLRGQAAASANGSLSEVLDRLVDDARMSGRTDAKAIRSVAGTIDLPADDPDLAGADSYVRALFDRSLKRPMLVREKPPAPPAPRRRKRS
jgi:hypothetical protein